MDIWFWSDLLIGILLGCAFSAISLRLSRNMRNSYSQRERSLDLALTTTPFYLHRQARGDVKLHANSSCSNIGLPIAIPIDDRLLEFRSLHWCPDCTNVNQIWGRHATHARGHRPTRIEMRMHG